MKNEFEYRYNMNLMILVILVIATLALTAMLAIYCYSQDSMELKFDIGVKANQKNGDLEAKYNFDTFKNPHKNDLLTTERYPKKTKGR